jgi:acyl-CoA hydrolase
LSDSGDASRHRPVIAYADGPDSARSAPAAIADVAGLGPHDVLMGWTPADRPWLASPTLRGRTVVAGYALAAAVADHRIEYLPVRLSAVPRLVSGIVRPEVAVVAGVRRGRDLVFAGGPGWGPAVARAADQVVVELHDDVADLGGPPIPGQIVTTVDAPGHDDPPPEPRRPDAVDLEIGRKVVSLLPDDPTVQLGPGGIAAAIVASIDRPVRIWSGLITDAMAGLAERGLLADRAVAAYTWGGRPIAQLAAAGSLRLLPVEETHNSGRISAIDRFVACNTALQVGLDGSVNVERVGGRLVTGIGGHPDFCAGAIGSDGGLSVIALRSTTRRGASTIVTTPEVVSTPRCDVEVVVTEHGIAELRGVDDDERARRLVAIAAPEHRRALQA